MNNLQSFILFCVVLCYLNFINEVKSKEEAVVFNHKSKQLLERPKYQEGFGKTPITCITACPPSSDDDKKINDNFSITGNGIFLQKDYENEIPKTVETEICKTSYKPAMVLDTSSDTYETGYELFYEDETIKLNYSKYEKLRKVIDGKANTKGSHNAPVLRIKPKQNENTYFQLIDRDTIWVFFWISVLSIHASGSERQITFTQDIPTPRDYSSINRKMVICEDFNLGNEVQTESAENKLQLLSLLKDSNIEKTPGRTVYSLSKTQIMPMRYLHTFSAKLATCTELNLAYVWKAIADEQYKRVDKYLYSIYRKWYSNINIIFGVKGLLDAIQPNLLEEMNKRENLIFHKFPMSAPEVLYRIVEFKKDSIILNVIIVIHNDLAEVLPEDKRICNIGDEVKGWNEIKNHIEGEASRPGLTYACPVTSQTLKKLDIRYYEITPSMEPLVLNEDQVSDSERDDWYINILDQWKLVPMNERFD